MIFCDARAYKNPQKNTRRVFSVHLFFIVLVYKLINSEEMAEYIKVKKVARDTKLDWWQRVSNSGMA